MLFKRYYASIFMRNTKALLEVSLSKKILCSNHVEALHFLFRLVLYTLRILKFLFPVDFKIPSLVSIFCLRWVEA